MTRQVSDYFLLTLIWELHHVAYVPGQFCQICCCLSRIGQKWELPNQSEQNVVANLTGHPVLYHCTKFINLNESTKFDHKFMISDTPRHCLGWGGPTTFPQSRPASRWVKQIIDIHTLCGLRSVAILCKAFLKCSTGCWADTSATVQPNGDGSRNYTSNQLLTHLTPNTF